MIKTAIILRVEENFPIWHKNEGFAKNLEIAEWLFKLCGWSTGIDNQFPSLAHCVEVVEWPEGNKYFPIDTMEHWILGERMILN